jgi:hypothetical protein
MFNRYTCDWEDQFTYPSLSDIISNLRGDWVSAIIIWVTPTSRVMFSTSMLVNSPLTDSSGGALTRVAGEVDIYPWVGDEVVPRSAMLLIGNHQLISLGKTESSSVLRDPLVA